MTRGTDALSLNPPSAGETSPIEVGAMISLILLLDFFDACILLEFYAIVIFFK